MIIILDSKRVHELIKLVKTIRANKAYKGNPIVCNEDDHFNFEADNNHFLSITGFIYFIPRNSLIFAQWACIFVR